MSQNQLLDYIKCLEQQSVNELTASQDEDTAEAMNSFVHRLLGAPCYPSCLVQILTVP